jgi:hypothetical protein
MFRHDSEWKAHNEHMRVIMSGRMHVVQRCDTSKIMRFELARSNKTEQLHINSMGSIQIIFAIKNLFGIGGLAMNTTLNQMTGRVSCDGVTLQSLNI